MPKTPIVKVSYETAEKKDIQSFPEQKEFTIIETIISEGVTVDAYIALYAYRVIILSLSVRWEMLCTVL